MNRNEQYYWDQRSYGTHYLYRTDYHGYAIEWVQTGQSKMLELMKAYMLRVKNG